MAKPKASDLKIVIGDTTTVPVVYSNHQGVGRTAMEVTITFNMVQLPLDGAIPDNTLRARPVVQVVMSPLAAVGLLDTLASQLGKRVEDLAKPSTTPKTARGTRRT